MPTATTPPWYSKYIGLKFGDKGRGPEEFDCWGLVRWIYMKELNIVLPDYMDSYKNVVDRDAITSTIEIAKDDSWERVQVPSPFDVMVLNIYGKPLHVGIVIARDRFLHSPQGDMSRLERYTDHMWNRRVEGFYSHV